MSKTFKIVFIILILASVISASLAVFGLIGKEREYLKRVMIEEKFASLLNDKKDLEKELKLSKKAQEEAESKIDEIEKKLEDLTKEVASEKEKRESLAQDLETKRREILRLSKDLEAEKKEKKGIEGRIEDLEFKYEKAEREVARLKEEKTKLKERISNLEKSVELEPIVVKPSGAEALPQSAEVQKAPLKGKVLVVNKEYSFIVTDLGKDDGIEKGMVFDVRDGGLFLGKAQIDKIYDTMSSATILGSGKINEMKKGNSIIESR